MIAAAVLTRVGNYEIVRPLGTGGMAQTFVAKRRGPAGFEQLVCLKRVLPEYAMDRALVEQFLDEARLLARLRHANIVQVYDFGEADGSYFMALELVDGADLEVVVRHLRAQGKRVPVAIALHVVAETLKALNYAHAAQLDGDPLHLVHRDVSPSNLLLSRAGEVKLADFGIAKSRHRKHRTQAGFTKGKIAYMSPEQVRGELHIDGRSDLFAVGIVLHELLTGEHPFDADSDVVLLRNIMTGARVPLSSGQSSLRPELIRLLDALLATDPAERPSTAADALVLIPAVEQGFITEQRIGELVNSCVVERAAYADTMPRNAFDERPTRTASLPAPARAVPSDAETRDLESVHGTSAEMLGTDALIAAGVGRRTSTRWWLAALSTIFVLITAWMGLSGRDSESKVGAGLPQVPDAAAIQTVGPSPHEPEEPTMPAAAPPAAEPEPQEDPGNELPARSPTIFHSPSEEVPREALHRTRRRPIRAARDEATSVVREGPVASPFVPAAENPPVPPPVAPKPAAPEETRPAARGRVGVSLKSDDF